MFRVLITIVISFFINSTMGLYSASPTWITHNLFKAANHDIVTSRTRNFTTPYPNYTFTFTSNMSGTPYLAYGVKKYQGYDYLGQQFFQIIRYYLDSVKFSIVLRIYFATDILSFNVAYIAIDPSFPHLLGTFERIPVNYSAGPITNISIPSQINQTYTNIINFTQIAGDSLYNKFLEPLNRNKIVLFVTTLFMRGRNQALSTTWNHMIITIDEQKISTTQYMISITVSKLINISGLCFTMIVFDEMDIASAENYTLIYEIIQIPRTGGFITIPIEFVENFIMGFFTFTSSKTSAIMDFQWYFSTLNGEHVALMPESIGQTYLSSGNNTITSVIYSVFYAKSWRCPIDTFLDLSQNICIPCPIIGCVQCTKINSCRACNQQEGYFLFKNICLQCFSLFLDNKLSVCSLNVDIIPGSFEFQKLACHKFKIQIQIKSNDILNMIQKVKFNNHGLNIIQKQVSSGHVKITAEYQRDIYNETLELVIPSSSFLLRINNNYGVPLLKYQDDECKTYNSIKKLVQGIIIASYILLPISIFSAKIVGLELFGVLQLAYFSLAEHDFHNIYLSLLTPLKITNGLNLAFFPEPLNLLPANVKVLGVSASFINNCNIMLLVMFVELLVSLAIWAVGKIKKSENVLKLGQRLLKEGFITLVMFNTFNIAFSAGIHWKYLDYYDPLSIFSFFILCLTLFVVILATFCLEYLEQTGYGEFRYKFKQNFVCRSYITYSIVYRISLVLYIALKNDYDYASLMVLPISFTYIMYNIINLPFSNFIENYRCNLIHITQLITLFCANYYRSMKMNTPMQIKAHIHFPALLEIIMLTLCVFFSMIIITYSMTKKIILHIHMKRIKDQKNFIISTITQTQNSI